MTSMSPRSSSPFLSTARQDLEGQLCTFLASRRSSAAAIQPDCKIVIRSSAHSRRCSRNDDGPYVRKTKKARATGAMKKRKGSPRSTISSSSPLGLLALHLLEQWRKSGRDGIVFLSENENRTERLGSVLHSLDPSLDVLVFPRLNTLPFDGLEPSREIAGRRSSVLRRLAKTKKPVFLVSTAEAIMERLPLPTSWGRLSLSLQTRLEALGYDLDQEADYPGTALF